MQANPLQALLRSRKFWLAVVAGNQRHFAVAGGDDRCGGRGVEGLGPSMRPPAICQGPVVAARRS